MGTGHKTIEITDDMVIADEPIAKVAKIAYISGVIGMVAAVGLGAIRLPKVTTGCTSSIPT